MLPGSALTDGWSSSWNISIESHKLTQTHTHASVNKSAPDLFLHYIITSTTRSLSKLSNMVQALTTSCLLSTNVQSHRLEEDTAIEGMGGGWGMGGIEQDSDRRRKPPPSQQAANTRGRKLTTHNLWRKERE